MLGELNQWRATSPEDHLIIFGHGLHRIRFSCSVETPIASWDELASRCAERPDSRDPALSESATWLEDCSGVGVGCRVKM